MDRGGRKVKDSPLKFNGQDVKSISSPFLRIDYLGDAGPRLVRLFLAGSQQNLLAEVPKVRWKTPYGIYHVWGGHRLWHSPEVPVRTYVPDNHGLSVEEIPGGVRLVQPVEASTGIHKSIEIRLDQNRPAATLVHELKNEGLWEVELAAWPITQLPTGGVAILPQQKGPLGENAYLPNRTLSLWPYTRWEDERLSLGDDYILIYGKPVLPPLKVGYFCTAGWLGYLRAGVLFRKRFDVLAGPPHPDYGCNAECYANDMFVEVESLSPLVRLLPGQLLRHTETWELINAASAPEDPSGLRRWLSER